VRGPGGYGRYDDDLGQVGCPRAKTDMTPCIARDGSVALAESSYAQTCVGCDVSPRLLLGALARELGRDVETRIGYDEAAERLRDLVREVTEPSYGTGLR
jgi:hypothetical protein